MNRQILIPLQIAILVALMLNLVLILLTGYYQRQINRTTTQTLALHSMALEHCGCTRIAQKAESNNTR